MSLLFPRHREYPEISSTWRFMVWTRKWLKSKLCLMVIRGEMIWRMANSFFNDWMMKNNSIFEFSFSRVSKSFTVHIILFKSHTTNHYSGNHWKLLHSNLWKTKKKKKKIYGKMVYPWPCHVYCIWKWMVE